MFFELIATIFAGFAGAGLAHLLIRLTGRRLPKWLIPIAAGAAMIGTTISNEYTWFNRTVAGLPPGLEVALKVEESAAYRPWAYLFPFVTRFLAVDMTTMRTNAALPDQRMVDVYAFGRWRAPQRRLVMVDCASGARADVAPGSSVSVGGGIEGLSWRNTGAADPIVSTSCGGGV